jgi:hypothetical protein
MRGIAESLPLKAMKGKKKQLEASGSGMLLSRKYSEPSNLTK